MFYKYTNLLKAYVNRSAISKRFFKGFSWTLLGSVIGKFLQLISFIIVARLLGKEDYGKISIIRSTVSMFLMFSTLGMGMTATRYISLYRNTDPYKALKVYKFSHNTVVIFGLVIAILFFIFSGFIAENSLNDVSLSMLLKISSFVLFFISISAAQVGALNGFEDFKALGIHSIFNGVAQTILLIVGVYYFSVNGVIVALGISAAILYLQYNHALKSNLEPLKLASSNENDEFDNKSIFLKFSLPAVLSGLVTVPVLWWAKTYLIRHTGFGEMALYDVAEQWYFMLLYIPNSLSSIILPLLTNITKEGTEAQYSKLIKINLIINISITSLIAIFIAFFTPMIYKFYGKEFSNSTPLVILLVTAVLCATNNVLGQVIASKGKMWIGLGVNSLWAIWLVLFSLLFIGKMNLGASGLAYAMLASYLFHSITQALVAIKIKTLSH